MILTDREIAAALKSRHLIIEPPPNAEAFSSTSIDLRLSETFAIWKKKAGMSITPGADNFKYSEFQDLQEKHKVKSFSLKSQCFVLAWTEETVRIPVSSCLAARVEGKSSMARLGISVHVTAPTIHCGFEGSIQLEMYNFGPHEINLTAGMRICQLIIEQTYGTPDKGYDGMFFQQPQA